MTVITLAAVTATGAILLTGLGPGRTAQAEERVCRRRLDATTVDTCAARRG
jgi:hypothetical protein